jgi:DNA-binding phage protein
MPKRETEVGNDGVFAERIRTAIVASGRPLTHLAKDADMDDGMLSRFMRNQRDLTMRSMERLCSVLGLDLLPKK